MEKMKDLVVGLLLVASLSGCELAGVEDLESPNPVEPTLTGTPLCVKECAEANDSCIVVAAREFAECVEDMSEPPICNHCILMCHLWFEQKVQSCNAVASRCTAECLNQ